MLLILIALVVIGLAVTVVVWRSTRGIRPFVAAIVRDFAFCFVALPTLVRESDLHGAFPVPFIWLLVWEPSNFRQLVSAFVIPAIAFAVLLLPIWFFGRPRKQARTSIFSE